MATITAKSTAAQIAAASTDEITAYGLGKLTKTQFAGLTAAQISGLTTSEFSETMIGWMTAKQVAGLPIATLSNDQIAALTPANIIGLTTAQIGSMTSTQVGAIETADLIKLTAAQIKALNAENIVGLTFNAVSGQMGKLTSAQIAAIETADLRELTADQIAGLSTANISKLSNAQIAALKDTQVAAIETVDLVKLTTAQIKALTTENIKGLTQDQLGKLTTAQVAAIEIADFAQLSKDQIGWLSTANIKGLTAAQIKALDGNTIQALTADKMGKLTTAQVAAIETADIANLTQAQIEGLSTANISKLSNAQIAALSADQIGWIETADLVKLTTAQIKALTADNIQGLSLTQMGKLTTAQVAAIETADLANLSTEQIAGLSTANISKLSSAQMAALSADQVAAIELEDLAKLSTAQIKALTTANISGLTIDTVVDGTTVSGQIGKLSKAQLAAIETADLVSLSTEQIAALSTSNITGLTNAQMAALTADQVAAIETADLAMLGTAQIKALSTANIQGLTAAQMGKLTKAQVAAIENADLAKLSAEQIAGFSDNITALTSAQMAALTSEQVAAIETADLQKLGTAQIKALTPTNIQGLTVDTVVDTVTVPGQMGKLTAAQVAAIEAADLAKLSAEQIAGFSDNITALTEQQMAALTSDQVAAIETADLVKLGTAQIKALTPTNIQGLTVEQMDKLTADQVGAIETADLARLSEDQIAGLSATNIEGLSADQIGKLTVAQLAAIEPDDLAAIDPAKITALTTANITGLTVDQMGKLTADQVKAIESTDLARLSADQIAALSPTNIKGLSADQIGKLSVAQVAAIELVDLQALDNTQIGALTTANITGLSAEQLGALSAGQVGAILPAAFAKLDLTQITHIEGAIAAQFAALSPAQVQAITSEVIANLSLAQLSDTLLAALSPEQIDAFTATQIGGLTGAQIKALGADGESALLNDATQAAALQELLAKPGTTIAGFNAAGASIAFELTGTNDADTFVGGSGDDTITGGGAADKMEGGAGDDVFVIGATDHAAGETITGGDGTDVIRFTAAGKLTLTANVEVEEAHIATETGDANGTAAADIDASSAKGAIKLYGNNGKNELTGNASDNTIDGDAGDDTITGGAGKDTLSGGDGDDLFIVSAADVVADESYDGGGQTNSDTLRVTGTVAVNLSDVTLTGIEKIDLLTDDGDQTVTMSVAQRLDASIDATLDDKVTVLGAFDASLDYTQLAQGNANITLDDDDNKVTLDRDDADKLRDGLAKFTAGDEITLADTGTTLAGLTFADYQTGDLGGASVTLDASDAVTLSKAKADELKAAGLKFAADDVITLTGDATTLAALDFAAYQTNDLGGASVTLDASDAVTLNATQAAALKAAGLKFATDDTITLKDTGENLAALDLTYDLGGTVSLDASDDKVSLTADQAAALPGDFAAQDVITLADTGEKLAGLSFADYTTTDLGGKSVTLDVNGDNKVTLTKAQADALKGVLKFAAEDVITVTGDGTALAVLTFANYTTTALGGASVTLDASDDAVSLTKTQADALKAAGIKFAADDVITVTETGANLAALNFADYTTAKLGGASVTLDASDNAVTLTKTQADALKAAGLKFAADDVITLSDTGENLAKLAFAEYETADLGGASVTLDATDNTVTLSGTQAVALQAAGMAFATDDLVTVEADATYTLAASFDNLRLTGSDPINGTGNDSANVIIGNSGANSISGGGGNDTLTGGADNDTLTGGAGNDTFNVDAGTDTITDLGKDADNADTLNIAKGATAIATGILDFTGYTVTNLGTVEITGTDASDTIVGTTGADSITGGKGDDNLTGAAGDDTFNVDSGADTITDLNLSDTLKVTAGATAIATGILNFTGYNVINSGTISITGTASAETIVGTSGADSIDGGAEADKIEGGNGNDTIKGGASDDTLTGGAGNDTFTVDFGTDTITDLNKADDTLNVAAGAQVKTGILDFTGYTVNNLGTVLIEGTGAPDSIVGTGGADSVTGGAGADTITGGGGADTLYGGGGDDVFVITESADVSTDQIHGDTGNDTIQVDGAAVDLSAANLTGVEFLTSTYAGASTTLTVGNQVGVGAITTVSSTQTTGTDVVLATNAANLNVVGVTLTNIDELRATLAGNNTITVSNNQLGSGKVQKIATEAKSGDIDVLQSADATLNLTGMTLLNIDKVNLTATSAAKLTMDADDLGAGKVTTVAAATAGSELSTGDATLNLSDVSLDKIARVSVTETADSRITMKAADLVAGKVTAVASADDAGTDVLATGDADLNLSAVTLTNIDTVEVTRIGATTITMKAADLGAGKVTAVSSLDADGADVLATGDADLNVVGVTLANIDTLRANGVTGANVITVSSSQLGAGKVQTVETESTGTDILRSADGTLDLTGMTLTNIDKVEVTANSVAKITMDAADLGTSYVTTVAAATAGSELATNDANLDVSALTTLTNIGTLSASGKGDNVITVKNAQLKAAAGSVEKITTDASNGDTDVLQTADATLNLTGMTLTNIDKVLLANTGGTKITMDAAQLGVGKVETVASANTSGSELATADATLNLTGVSLTNISTVSAGVTGTAATITIDGDELVGTDKVTTVESVAANGTLKTGDSELNVSAVTLTNIATLESTNVLGTTFTVTDGQLLSGSAVKAVEGGNNVLKSVGKALDLTGVSLTNIATLESTDASGTTFTVAGTQLGSGKVTAVTANGAGTDVLQMAEAGVFDLSGVTLTNIDEIRGTSDADTITGTTAADTIALGGADDTVVFASGLTDNRDSGFYNGGATGTMDVISGAAIGDKLQLWDGFLASGTTVASTYLTDITANRVAIVQGTFGTGSFAAGAGDDYIVQWADDTKVHSVLLTDVAGTVTLTANATSDTLTLAAGGTPPDTTLPTASAFTATATSVGATSNENGTLGLYDGSNALLANMTEETMTAGSAASITVVDQSSVTSATLKVKDAAGNVAVDTQSVVLGTEANGDTITGTANADFIFGFGGNDTITGGAGADVLTGGGGADTFVYSALGQGGGAVAVDTSVLAAGDTITDFVSGTDKINVAAGATTDAAATGVAGAWDASSAGVYIVTGSVLNFVQGTTTSTDVANAIGGVSVPDTAPSFVNYAGYVAILDDQGTVGDNTDDTFTLFEVSFAAQGASSANLMFLSGATISLVGVINSDALVASDFTFV